MTLPFVEIKVEAKTYRVKVGHKAQFLEAMKERSKVTQKSLFDSEEEDTIHKGWLWREGAKMITAEIKERLLYEQLLFDIKNGKYEENRGTPMSDSEILDYLIRNRVRVWKKDIPKDIEFPCEISFIEYDEQTGYRIPVMDTVYIPNEVHAYTDLGFIDPSRMIQALRDSLNLGYRDPMTPIEAITKGVCMFLDAHTSKGPEGEIDWRRIASKTADSKAWRREVLRICGIEFGGHRAYEVSNGYAGRCGAIRDGYVISDDSGLLAKKCSLRLSRRECCDILDGRRMFGEYSFTTMKQFWEVSFSLLKERSFPSSYPFPVPTFSSL